MNTAVTNVDEYIKSFPADVQPLLEQMRHTIKRIATNAEESIGYGMPAYKLYGKPLVYFGGFKSHIGFYATPTGHVQFAKELEKYKQGKGSVQFSIEEPLPLNLVAKIVKFRVKENLEKSKKK